MNCPAARNVQSSFPPTLRRVCVPNAWCKPDSRVSRCRRREPGSPRFAVPPRPGLSRLSVGRTGRQVSAAGDSGTARQRRHGGGLQGPAARAGPAGGREDSAAGDRPRSGVRRTVSARGSRAGAAESSAHRRRLRLRCGST